MVTGAASGARRPAAAWPFAAAPRRAAAPVLDDGEARGLGRAAQRPGQQRERAAAEDVKDREAKQLLQGG